MPRYRNKPIREISIRAPSGRDFQMDGNRPGASMDPHSHWPVPARWVCLLVFVTLVCTGCGWMQTPKFHTPSLHHPGTAAEQQYAAIRHDPYPLNDIGPEVLGGRPRDFDKPPNEVTRARQGLPWGNWRGYPQ